MQSTNKGSRTYHIASPAAIIRSVYAKRDLLLQITKRNIEADFKGSYLGIAWTVVEPLLTLAIYGLVFGMFLGARFVGDNPESGFEFAIALFLGLTVFNLFADALNRAPSSIASVPNYVKKVVFPVELLPLSVVLASAVRFLVSLMLLVIVLAISGKWLAQSALLLPVVMLPVFVMSVGMAWILAALGVFIRDVGKIMRLATLVLLYGSAIFYPPQLIESASGWVWSILQWNPVLLAVDMARRALLWDMGLSVDKLIYLYVLALLIFVVGYALFMVLRPAFSDVVR